MANPAVDIGTGITLTFATTSFTCEILEVTPPGYHRDSVNTSHQGTTGAHTKAPKDLYDVTPCEFNFHFDPTKHPPIGDAAELITVGFPSGASHDFTGFMTDYTPEGVFEDKMVGSARLEVSGAVDRNASS